MRKPKSARWRSRLNAVSPREVLTFLALSFVSFAHAATLSLNANPVNVSSGAPDSSEA